MDIKFIHDINKNYMVLSFDKVDARDYRMKMIRNKEIPGLLKVKQKVIDSKEKLYYDISSLQSIEVLYEKKHMESEEIKKIILGLENCINSLRVYLLDFNDIILNPKMVFVEMKELNYSFSYCPYHNGDFRKELKEYMNFVITKIDHSDLDTLNLAYELQKITCRENYVIGDLVELINEPVNEPFIEHVELKIDKTPVIQEKSVKEGYINKGIVVALVMGLIVWGFVFFKTENSSVRKSILVMFFAALIYVVYLFLKSRKKVVKQVVEKEEAEERDEQEIEEEETRTVFLGNSDFSKTRFLKNTERPDRDIRLEKLPLIIGKIQERSDIVIEENSVSRIHARLTEENDLYYIEDLNSTNGTFINGRRLVPYEKEIIEKGDLVGISEIHYKFV